MPEMYRLFLCVAILSVAIPVLAETNCAELIERPSYPPLARQAVIEGEVKAHFDVGADGKPAHLALEGHPLLKQAVESAISKTTLDTACGTVELVYKFSVDIEVKDPAQTSFAFNPPNEYVITTSHPPPTGPDYGVVRRSWVRRLFHF
jgi:hypothetical protein